MKHPYEDLSLQEEIVEENDNGAILEQHVSLRMSRESLNSTLSNIELSPIKVDSMQISTKLTFGKRKLDQIQEVVQRKMASVLNVDQNQLESALGVINDIKFLIKQEALKKQSFVISIKLIKAILIPKVLYACETWTNVTNTQIKSLEKLQKDAVTIINSLPQSTPYDGIVLECGLMPMEFRIKEKRLMYFHKVLNMKESRLTKIVYEEQKRLNFPNCWYKEVNGDIKVIDVNLKEYQIKNLTKEQWKKIFREKMIIIIENNIRNNKKTKLRFINGNKFEIKEYLGCEEASSVLKLKLNMVDLRANYKGKYTDSLCRRCGSHEEYIEHLWNCPSFYQKPLKEMTCLITNNSKSLKNIYNTLQEFLNQG